MDGGDLSDRGQAAREGPRRGWRRFAARPGWSSLIDVLVRASVDYLAGQVEAGVGFVQIFDSWAVDLPDGLRERYCFRPITADRGRPAGARGAVPVIGFARGLGAAHLEFVAATGVEACGIEPGVPLAWAAKALTPVAGAVQGNLDPVALMAGAAGLERDVERIVTTLPLRTAMCSIPWSRGDQARDRAAGGRAAGRGRCARADGGGVDMYLWLKAFHLWR